MCASEPENLPAVISFISRKAHDAADGLVTSIGYDVRNILRSVASLAVHGDPPLPASLWLRAGNYMDVESVLLPDDLRNYVDKAYMYGHFGIPPTFSFGQSALRDLAATVLMTRKLGIHSYEWSKGGDFAAYDRLIEVSALLTTKSVAKPVVTLPLKAQKKLGVAKRQKSTPSAKGR